MEEKQKKAYFKIFFKVILIGGLFRLFLATVIVFANKSSLFYMLGEWILLVIFIWLLVANIIATEKSEKYRLKYQKNREKPH